MTERKSVIHIGLHKTGSTTLQKCLADATEELRNQGFFYPTGYLPSRAQHSQLAQQLIGEEQGDFEGALGRILDDLAQLDEAALLLSGEAFSKLKRKHVARLYEGLARADRQFHIVLYVRNLYRYAISLVAQKSKTSGFIAYPDTALHRIGALNLAGIISTWEAVFGSDQVHIFCLEALPDPRGIISHFAEFSGFSFPPGMPLPEKNRSIDPIASALLTHLVHEFRLPHEIFYNPYFEFAQERVALPRTEHHLYRVVRPWVQKTDLDHPKLEPFRKLLRTRPTIEPGESDDGRKYLELLSRVLADVSKKLESENERHGRRERGAEKRRQARPTKHERRESRSGRRAAGRK